MNSHGGDIYGRVGDLLDFSSNTNFLGLPNGVKQALIDNIDSYSKYPDPKNTALKAAIAEYHGVPSSYIACGAGAADLIYRIVLAYKDFADVQHGGILEPSFSEYAEALCLFDVCYAAYSLTSDFKLCKPISEDIVFICNPNNPTGMLVDSLIIRETAKLSGLLVVDECFMDFVPDLANHSMLPYLQDHPNVIVLRAFTKTYAMAGLRLGYIVCSNQELVQRIENSLQPWAVSAPATVAGIAALKETAYLKQTRKLIPQNRAKLTAGLRALGLTVYDSDTNFILFRYKAGLKEQLLEKGILIRSCANFSGLDDTYYRIVVSSEENNSHFISCMEAII